MKGQVTKKNTYLVSCEENCQLWQSLKPHEQPGTMECPIRYFQVASDSGTMLCQIKRWECLGTLLLLFIVSYKITQETAGQNSSPKQSHGAVRHNTDPALAEPENGQWDTLFQNDGKFCFFFCFRDNRQFPFRVGPSLCFKARLSETIDIKIIFYSQANQAHYHKKGFALTLTVSKWGFLELGNG